MLSHSNRPQLFWEDAFVTVTCIINRPPTPILNQNYSYEVVYHYKLDYYFLKFFFVVLVGDHITITKLILCLKPVSLLDIV